MQKAMRINEFWRWLPVFRVVAEKQQLRSAAKILHVSPSAVSRTIKLVEDAVGASLFHRQGRNIRLTSSGQLLLQAVRSAMRLMDEGLTRATSGQYTGTVKVRAPAPLLHRVAYALEQVQVENPELVVHVISCPQAEVNQRLLRGEIDLALLDEPVRQEQIETGLIAKLSRGLYCGPGHPLAKVVRPGMAAILDHAFASMEAEDSHAPHDGWPHQQARRIILVSTDWYTVLNRCLSGQVLAVFDDLLVADRLARGELHRIGLAVIAPRTVFFAKRLSLMERDLADRVAEAIGHQLGPDSGSASGLDGGSS